MSDEFDEIEVSCPKCQHYPIRSRNCTNFCENGYFDLSDEDPINFTPGEAEEKCEECLGTGYEKWCPGCGANLSNVSFPNEDENL